MLTMPGGWHTHKESHSKDEVQDRVGMEIRMKHIQAVGLDGGRIA